MQKVGLVCADAGLGSLSALFVCWIFSTEPTVAHIFFGIMFAYIPDIDWVTDKHFWKTGNVAAYAANPYDHREGLHKPLLWALVISAWGVLFGGVYPFIAFVAVLLHFLHDTVGTGWGMPWFWPLTKRRFKFFATRDNELALTTPLVSWSYAELPLFITKHGRGNWKQHYYAGWTSVAVLETVVAVIGLSFASVSLLS